MKDNQSFLRKIIYLTVMAALLVPLNMISSPATNQGSGGTLARMRSKHDLSQANLGEIDPAGASMSLATLGMRGVAANLLWGRAYHYKKTENWDSFKATLNQITKLQPNFISVWKFQAWNLSYNISVEFDDYRHRYHWVKKGVDFLIEGTRFNHSEPRLLWDLGWFFGHKFGRSDEHVQFRRMFREDEDFHAEHFANSTAPIQEANVNGPEGPDNWLVARHWFLTAQRVVDTKAAPLKGSSPLIFHSDPPKALINFADAIEEEGYLDERAERAWLQAHRAWLDYGDRSIPTSFGYEIRLNDLEPQSLAVEELEHQFNQLATGIHDQIVERKKSGLSKEEQEVLAISPADRTPQQYELAISAEEKIKVTEPEVAERVAMEKRKEARRLAKQIVQTAQFVGTIRRYRDIVNFEYWRTRCEVEQQQQTTAARRHIYEANNSFDDARLIEARDMFEKGWDLWAEIFERYPMLLEDVEGEDLYDSVLRYEQLLGQLDEPFPPPGFKLTSLLQAQGREVVAPESADSTIINELQVSPAKEGDVEQHTNEPPAAEKDSVEETAPTTDDPTVSASLKDSTADSVPEASVEETTDEAKSK